MVCGAGLGAALGLGQVGFSHGTVLSHRKAGSEHRLGSESSHSRAPSSCIHAKWQLCSCCKAKIYRNVRREEIKVTGFYEAAAALLADKFY